MAAVEEQITMDDPISGGWEAQRAAVGMFIRSQRELSKMSLRELSRVTHVSNAYLSQLERGLHDPTLRILVQIGEALQVSVDEILRASAGDGLPADDVASSAAVRPVEAAIRADPDLTTSEKDALLTVYRSYLHSHR
jgi:transcriptional regulator with XRE-family HTH domain